MKVSVSGPHRLVLAVAAAYLATHVASVAPSLEDIDSINFALGLRDFDPSKHQPHPPGSPVYIALGRATLALVSFLRPTLERTNAEALALGVWSLVAGAVALVAAGRLFGLIAPQRPRATVWGVALLAPASLFWLSGLRPMSDMAGLAAALAAQVLILQGRGDRQRLVAGALLSGVAVGIRLQTAWLTAPLLLFSLVSQRAAGVWWLLTRPVAALTLGGLAWAVPLVVDSGGVNEYLAALGSQAGEDFAWVNMLWLDPTPRRLAFTLYETFIVPWGADGLAAVTVLTAAIGAALAIVTDRRTVMLLLVAFGPYAVLHLLFQETLTIRYALPTLVPVAWLAARALTARGGLWQAAPAVLVVAAMTVSLPTGVAYGREAHPAFRAIHDARFDARVDPPGAVYSHYGIWRSLQADPLPSMVEPSRQREWMGPATYWRDGGTRTVWFLADPRRTDLALIDPLARRDVRSYRWAVGDRRELGGTRPLGVDWYRLSPPGWFAGDGWSLTPETGGLASATGATPDVRPIEAWVRRRTGPLHLMVGGRHLGEPGAPDADFELALDGVVMDRWTLSVAQRNFVRFLDLPEGLPPQTAQYARLTILSRARGGDGQRAPVAVRQFDVQGSDRLIWAFGEGWHEAEYDVLQGRQWRWTSERSILLLSGASGDLRLSLRGESPLRYLDAPPAVRVLVGGRLVGQFRPAADFDWVVTVPLADLTRGEGAIVVETDPVYLPGVAEGTADERHLGLRVYETRLDPVTP